MGTTGLMISSAKFLTLPSPLDIDVRSATEFEAPREAVALYRRAG